MGALELREEVLKKVQDADERLLAMINALAISYQESEVIAYTVEGEPLSREQYKQELQEAKSEYKRGEYTAVDDFKKEIKDW
ncbi:hypothetical protein [uncultured Dokdonia sp.]|jgi:hypothetical protein|uniref:hypothetical protein n=1 Tax=unclassified Dokdonia TaxID=2615033 RepID=UPI00262554D1|nr:hypothetical protein [uncultured Dokdonia sp.]|tara:strand:- start:162415 stop:162660 length:246 start_codon:yes stop_codon:yes gene_type:complete